MKAVRKGTQFSARDAATAVATNPTGHHELPQRIAALNGLTAQQLRDEWDRPPEVTGAFVGVNMTFDGNLVLVTDEGWIVVVDRDFGDFVASIDVENGNNNSQNAELVPEQSWVGTAEFNQKLGPWGAVKLGLEGRLVEDVIDQKLIPQIALASITMVDLP